LPERSEDGHIEILYRESSILARLDELALELMEAYAGKEVHALAILHGSVIFAADLLRRLPLPVHLHTLNVSSYHGEKTSSGTVSFHHALPSMEGKHVLLLDDILDTGRTLQAIQQRLAEGGRPQSVRVCVLLQKRKPRPPELTADHVGFEIDDEFVIGYGLDYQGRYRNLPYIATLDDTP
jgi:hypoxanthine phosphoribosyltransferase